VQVVGGRRDYQVSVHRNSKRELVNEIDFRRNRGFDWLSLEYTEVS